MRLPSLGRLVGGAALVFAAVVLTHGATCRVVHSLDMPGAPSGSHAPSMNEHFPKAVVESAGAASLAALFGLFALWLVRRPPANLFASSHSPRLSTGRSPPDPFGHDLPSPIALCVFRC